MALRFSKPRFTGACFFLDTFLNFKVEILSLYRGVVMRIIFIFADVATGVSSLCILGKLAARGFFEKVCDPRTFPLGLWGMGHCASLAFYARLDINFLSDQRQNRG